MKRLTENEIQKFFPNKMNNFIAGYESVYSVNFEKETPKKYKLRIDYIAAMYGVKTAWQIERFGGNQINRFEVGLGKFQVNNWVLPPLKKLTMIVKAELLGTYVCPVPWDGGWSKPYYIVLKIGNEYIASCWVLKL